MRASRGKRQAKREESASLADEGKGAALRPLLAALFPLVASALLEGKPSPSGRLTFTTWHHWKKDDALLPSGLLGPVTVRSEIRVPIALTAKSGNFLKMQSRTNPHH